MTMSSQTAYKLWPFGLVIVSLGVSQSVIISSCGFEKDFCGWTTASWANGSWTRRRGSGSYNTGPLQAFQDDYYIYLDTDQFKGANGLVVSGKLVSILSPKFSSVGCVTFVYMKYGSSNGVLRVGLYLSSGTKEVVLEIPGQTNRTWLCIQNVSFSSVKQNVQVFIEAASGPNILGETALDAVYVYNDSCPLNSTCKLETTSTSDFTSAETSSTTDFWSSSTIPMDNSTEDVSWSSTANPDSTTSGSGSVFDLNILYVLIVPGVVLIIAVVIAIVCFRQRQARRAEDTPDPYYLPTSQGQEDEYDLPNETEMISTNQFKAPPIPHDINSCDPQPANPYHNIDETSGSFRQT